VQPRAGGAGRHRAGRRLIRGPAAGPRWQTVMRSTQAPCGRHRAGQRLPRSAAAVSRDERAASGCAHELAMSTVTVRSPGRVHASTTRSQQTPVDGFGRLTGALPRALMLHMLAGIDPTARRRARQPDCCRSATKRTRLQQTGNFAACPNGVILLSCDWHFTQPTVVWC
jgi:hypothetical protein